MEALIRTHISRYLYMYLILAWTTNNTYIFWPGQLISPDWIHQTVRDLCIPQQETLYNVHIQKCTAISVVQLTVVVVLKSCITGLSVVYLKMWPTMRTHVFPHSNRIGSFYNKCCFLLIDPSFQQESFNDMIITLNP